MYCPSGSGPQGCTGRAQAASAFTEAQRILLSEGPQRSRAAAINAVEGCARVRVHPESLLIETREGMLEVDRSFHEYLTLPSPLSLTIGPPIALRARTESVVAGSGPFRSAERRRATRVRDAEENGTALAHLRVERARTALKVTLACAFTQGVVSLLVARAL